MAITRTSVQYNRTNYYMIFNKYFLTMAPWKKTKDTFGVGAKEWENDIHKSHTQKTQSKSKKTDLDHEVRWLEKSKLLSAG